MDVKGFFKKVGGYIIAFVGGVIAFLLGKHIVGTRTNDRDTSSGFKQVRNDIDTAVAGNNDAKKRVDDIKNTVEHVESITNNLESSTRECLDIIRRAKQNAVEKES